jgi:alpha-ribazole phosphatase CobZ
LIGGTNIKKTLLKELERRGISSNDIIAAILELHVPHPSVETNEKAARMARRELDQAFSDANVSMLVMAGLKLEEDAKRGLIPGVSKREFEEDPRWLVADEVLGMAIANYIAGSKGVFEYIRFDKAKPGILKKLGPIADDVIAGLIGGISSNMYTRATDRR